MRHKNRQTRANLEAFYCRNGYLLLEKEQLHLVLEIVGNSKESL